MKPEETRDQALEQWLRRSAQTDATLEVSPECLDAETLAAWADGTLSAREITTIETHVAGCAHCQAMAAVLIRATPTETAVVPWWRRSLRSAWLVPLTAGAAAVALWVVVPGERQTAQPSPAPSTVLAERQPGEEAKGADPKSAAANPAKPAAAEPAKSKQRVPQSAADVGGQRLERQRVDAVGGARTTADERREVAALKDEPRVAQEKPRDTLTVATPAVAAPPPPAAAAPRTQSTVTGAAQSRLNESTADALLAKRVATTREVGFVGTPTVRWRFGAAGSIARTDDGGRSWVAQTSGVTMELLAGVCPSSSTCWIVGRNGTVLRTIDGQTWTQVTAPDDVDLVRVDATDGASAVVSTIDARQFRTSDAGRTWERISLQDF